VDAAHPQKKIKTKSTAAATTVVVLSGFAQDDTAQGTHYRLEKGRYGNLNQGKCMTRTAIAEKLVEHMGKSPSSESDVSYAMAEIRKTLEFDRAKKENWALSFYCDWVLHTELTGPGAKKILGTIEQILGKFKDGDDPATFDPSGALYDILSFHLLRSHLSKFLKENDMPTLWVEDPFVWPTTVRFYGRLVQDSPLKHTFKLLRTFVLASCEPSDDIVRTNAKGEYFGFKWQFTLNDGSTFFVPFTSNVPKAPSNWKPLGVADNRPGATPRPAG
jgi:hypothetical protein